MIGELLTNLIAWFVRRFKKKMEERPTDRERYLLWKAAGNGGNIFTYSGLGQVPGGRIIVIGDFSTEKLPSYESMLEDFEALERLEALGHIKRVSRVKLVLTESGRTLAERHKF